MEKNINKTFGRIASGYDPRPARKKSRTHGTLLIDNLPVLENKPFFILQMAKKSQYAHIFPKSRLRIVSMLEY